MTPAPLHLLGPRAVPREFPPGRAPTPTPKGEMTVDADERGPFLILVISTQLGGEIRAVSATRNTTENLDHARRFAGRAEAAEWLEHHGREIKALAHRTVVVGLDGPLTFSENRGHHG